VPLTRHLQPLALLWSASVLVAGMNFLATLLIVAKASPDTFAAYAVGLSVLMIGSNWSDAGLASTLQVLATQPGNDRRGLEQYKEVGLRYAKRIVPLGLSITVGLTGVLFSKSQVFHAQGNFYLLAAFAVIGVLAARTSFWNALLYSSGNFKRSSIVQAVPAVVRVILIGTAITLTGLNFGLLMVLTLLPVLLGWGLARYAWWRTIAAMPCPSGQQRDVETNAEVWRFLKPTMASVIFNSVSYNITLLGASFFTTGVSIAGYGLFQRINQAIVVLIGPLNTYVGRQLYMASPVERRHKGRLYLVAGTSIYMIYGFVAVFIYWLLRQHVHHYSLNFQVEFIVFLLSNLFGFLFGMLDTVLVSTRTADHRIFGSFLFICLNTLLILILHPDNLLLMVIIDATCVLPSVVYYGYLFMRKRSCPAVCS
jgi:O-antigen/teichoic acid export membrane protein